VEPRHSRSRREAIILLELLEALSSEITPPYLLNSDNELHLVLERNTFAREGISLDIIGVDFAFAPAASHGLSHFNI
jgi:hypothetical protein